MFAEAVQLQNLNPKNMKNVMIAVLMLAGLSGFAQEKRSADKPSRERVEMTAEQRNDLRLKQMTLKLDLNASQQKEVARIIAEQETKRSAAIADMKAKREKNTKPTADEVYARQSKRLDEQIAMKQQMKKVLTEDQFKKWERMSQHKKRGFKSGMKKRHEKMPEPQD